jgi:Ulp1 family protease
LVPVNLRGNHWILVVCDIRSRRITYYDSLPIYTDESASELISGLIRFFDDFIAYKSTNNNQVVDTTADRIDEDTSNSNKVSNS